MDALPETPAQLWGHAGVIRTTVTGHWLGQAVSYDEVHANWCEARKKLKGFTFS